MEKGAATEANPVGFLDLPPEIRVQIYRYCLVFKHAVHIGCLPITGHSLYKWRIRAMKKSLLLMSKQISSEALDVLYSENTFEVILHERASEKLSRYIAAVNMPKIRRMQIVVSADGYPDDRSLDRISWSCILANLRRLTIVAQQPLNSRRLYDEPSMVLKIERWLEWLRVVLHFIASHLPTSCAISVDDDNKTETRNLMREYLSKNYSEVQTSIGDFYFKRGNFAEILDSTDDEYYF